jgi:hypothetical protein
MLLSVTNQEKVTNVSMWYVFRELYRKKCASCIALFQLHYSSGHFRAALFHDDTASARHVLYQTTSWVFEFSILFIAINELLYRNLPICRLMGTLSTYGHTILRPISQLSSLSRNRPNWNSEAKKLKTALEIFKITSHIMWHINISQCKVTYNEHDNSCSYRLALRW